MSHIGFRSIDGDANVGGRERAYCGILVSRVADAILDLDGMVRFASDRERKRLFDILGLQHEMDLRYFTSTLLSPTKTIEGEAWDIWHLELNTIMVFGSMPLRLCARVHAQCEIHGYVEGPHRAWLADIIDEGLTHKVLRKETQGYGKGWEDVSALLRKSSDSPVVMDYSVTNGFPHPPDRLDENELEEWHEKSHEEKWGESIEWLRSESGYRVELNPETFSLPEFGDGRTFVDLADFIFSRLMKMGREATCEPQKRG